MYANDNRMTNKERGTNHDGATDAQVAWSRDAGIDRMIPDFHRKERVFLEGRRRRNIAQGVFRPVDIV